MVKKTVAICNVLKPVTDTRSLEKMAYTLVKGNNYEVNIIGFRTKKIPDYPNVKFYPVFSFGSRSTKRLFAGYKIFKILLKVKPKIIIASTPEIQYVTWLYKILFGIPVIYDIRENWKLNAVCEKHRTHLPKLIMAHLIRVVESLFSCHINHFILAERVYERQLNFIGKRYTICENTFNPQFYDSNTTRRGKSSFELLFCGTLSERFGLNKAIALAEEFHRIDHSIRLRIVGHCPSKLTYNNLIKLADNKGFIMVEASLEPIEHSQIIEAIQQADAGLICYQKLTCVEGKRPTTVFEFLALKLPFIVFSGLEFEYLNKFPNTHLRVSQNASENDLNNILLDLKTTSFYRDTNVEPAKWGYQDEARFLNLVENMTNTPC